MNQRRAAGSTGVAYIRWLLRARPADYMLALSVAGGSLPVVGKHLKPLGGVTAIGVWGARHASDFLSATAKDLLTPGINEVRRRDRASTQEVSVAALRGIVSPDDLADAKLIVTGEGRFDEQSLHGKVVGAIAAAARPLAIPVIVLAGQVSLDKSALRSAGIMAALSIAEYAGSVRLALADAANQLMGLASQVAARLGNSGPSGYR